MGAEPLFIAGISAIGAAVAYLNYFRKYVSKINERLRNEALTHATRTFKRAQQDEITFTDLEVICRKLRKRRHLIDDVKHGAMTLFLIGIFLFLAGYMSAHTTAYFISLTLATFALIPLLLFTMRVIYETEKET